MGKLAGRGEIEIKSGAGVESAESISRKINKMINLCSRIPFGDCLADLAVGLRYRWTGVKPRKISLYKMKLYYLEAGKGPHLVLLHGLGASSLGWILNIRSLRKKFHVLAPDQIGSGRSDKPLLSYRISIMAEYLFEFLSALNIPKILLVGSSMGGWTAAHFATNYPEMVEKLVLVDSAGFALERPLTARERELLNAVTLSSSRSFARELFFCPDFIEDPGLKMRLKMKLNSHEPYVIDRFLDAIDQKQDVVDNRLSLIKAPTLIIWGREDRLIPVDHALRFHREIAGSKLVIFDQCGHVPQVEMAARFNQEILDFLAD
ncbi:MAG: alpha/beta hydrolase [bacterium]